MTASLFHIVSLGTDGAIWRAVLVASLALIAFVLLGYWRSLSRHPTHTRYLLLGLRATSLVLLVCALAGVRVNYEAANRPSLLIHTASAHPGLQSERDKRSRDEAMLRVTNTLERSNFQVVNENNPDGPLVNGATAPYLAAVLLTDGAMQADEARRQVERVSLTAGGAPVYVVTDWEEKGRPSVALESVSVMSRPVRGVPIAVRCVVRAQGMRGRASLVTISDDAQVRVSLAAHWASDDERQVLTLEVTPKTEGWINYVARIEAAGDEDRAELSRAFTIYAEERRQRLLFFEGEPTWEAKFIRRALEEAELFDIDYFARVSRDAAAGVTVQDTGDKTPESEPARSNEGGPTPEAKLRAVLASSHRLNEYDLIIIGATPDAMLSAAEASRLRDWVERRGGGLLILGTNAFGGSVVAPKGKLSSLSPALIDSSSFRSDSETPALARPVEAQAARASVPLTPTKAGANGALRGFLTASEEATSLLTGQGLRLGTLRAGAIAMAVNRLADQDGTSEAGAPIVAGMRYGAGRTIVFAPADSWRMRTSASGEPGERKGPFEALWQGIALWSASDARLPVEVVLNDESPAVGTTVVAEIVVRDQSFSPLKIERVAARLQPAPDSTQASEGAESLEISFAPNENRPNIWRAEFTTPAIGRYNLQISYAAEGGSGEVAKYFAVIAPSALAAGTSRDTLYNAARESGGGLFTASQLNELAENLTAQPQQKETIPRIWELRSWWPLSLIVPLMLSCEWLILRMRSID